ncbi:MAG: hypothetical protein JRN15_12130 [Nitrososphaerota archaeon]|nr:hypothetical protein [Nitrososphaerota archaeon]
MQTIPLQAVPSQSLQVTLDGQLCLISVYVKDQCMLFDLAVGGMQIVTAVECSSFVTLVPTAYLGFSGWLLFVDMQGNDDPVYTGLGSRWVLLYIDSTDVVNYGLS